MRHRVKAKHFNTDTKGRKALFKGLLVNLFEQGTIETTEPKAKQLKRLADKLIHRAQDGTVHARRVLEQFFGSRQVVNHLVDGVAANMQDRTSGFTRITSLGRRRGDDAHMVKIELLSAPTTKESAASKEKKAEKAVKAEPAEKTEEVTEKKPAVKKAPAKKTTKTAKKTSEKKSE